MALVLKDRVKQTTTTTGTGSIVLNGTVDGFQTFAAALTDGDTTYYSIFEPSTNEWEVGLGTWTESTTTLARTTVLASSNSGSAVSLTAQAEVFISQPATKAAFFNADGDLDLSRDPQTALQAATKQYVDTIAAAGIHYHTPVRVESPSALTATYDNGTAGVGATLTNSGTQAALSIDGVTLSTSDRVLVYNQSNAAHNGIYTVTNTGSASTNWVLTRATDADSYGASDPDSLGEGDAFFVSEGDTGAGELYVMNTSGTITFGTTNITFTVIAETAVYAAGDGLTLTGTTFAVGAGTGVTVNANDVAIGQSVGTGDTVTFATVNAALTGNVTGNVTGDVTGNADTATALETARNIGGVSFDGTASINLPGVNTTGNQDTTGNAATATAWETGRTISLTGDVTGSVTGVDGSGNASIATTIAANSVALSTDTTGNYVQSVASGNYITGGAAGSEGAALTIGVDATPNNTASKVVARDASGNFSAGTVTVTGLTANGNITVTGTVDGRDVASDGSKLDGIETGATADQTASEILTLIKTVDGAGSGLDADTLDGISSGSFLRSDTSDSFTTLSGTTMTATTLRAGDGTDGRFYSDSAGRTAFADGDLYIQSSVSNFYNYATNQYLGDSSGDNIYTRGNTISGNSWSITGAGAASFASVNINGNLNAVDNIYLAGTLYHEGDTNTYLTFGTDTITLATGGSSEITVNTTGVRLGDTGNGYFQPVSGNYGSIQIDGGAHGSWEGYSIGGRAVFMHDNSNSMGLYDDVNNHWALQHTFNGTTQLYHNNSSKLDTLSDGVSINGNLYTDGSNAEDYDALSGTTPTCNVSNAGAFSLTMTGNTTFTFSGAYNNWSMGFILQLTGNGSTVTWPSSVKWAGGTAPDAPASGETDILVFHTRDGGTNWYGVLASDAAA